MSNNGIGQKEETTGLEISARRRRFLETRKGDRATLPRTTNEMPIPVEKPRDRSISPVFTEEEMAALMKKQRARKTPSKPTKQLESPPSTNKAPKRAFVAEDVPVEPVEGGRRSSRTKKPRILAPGLVPTPAIAEESRSTRPRNPRRFTGIGDTPAINDDPFVPEVERGAGSEDDSELEDDEEEEYPIGDEADVEAFLDGLSEDMLALPAITIPRLPDAAGSNSRSSKSGIASPSDAIDPLVQRFDSNLTLIINSIFDKAETLSNDADFTDWSKIPMSRSMRSFLLRYRKRRGDLLEKCLTSIGKDVKQVFGKEKWSTTDILALPENRTENFGIYGIFIEGPAVFDAYIGQTAARGARRDDMGRRGLHGFAVRWQQHERNVRKGIRYLEQNNSAQALYYSACKENRRMNFRALANFDVVTNNIEHYLLRGVLAVLESALMIYLHTYQIDSRSRSSTAAKEFAEAIRPSELDGEPWTGTLNRGFPLREDFGGFMPEDPWGEKEIEILRSTIAQARDEQSGVVLAAGVNAAVLPKGTWPRASSALKEEGYTRSAGACQAKYGCLSTEKANLQYWTEEQKKIVRDAPSATVAAERLAAIGVTRTRQAIYTMRSLPNPKKGRAAYVPWTDEEKKIARDAPNAAVAVERLAAIGSIRTEGSVHQMRSISNPAKPKPVPRGDVRWSDEQRKIAEDAPTVRTAVERLAAIGVTRTPDAVGHMRRALKVTPAGSTWTDEDDEIIRGLTPSVATQALADAGRPRTRAACAGRLKKLKKEKELSPEL